MDEIQDQSRLFNDFTDRMVTAQWMGSGSEPPEAIKKLLAQARSKVDWSHKVLHIGVAQAVSDLVLTAGRAGFLEECQTGAFMGLLTSHLHWAASLAESCRRAQAGSEESRLQAPVSWVYQNKHTDEPRTGADFAIAIDLPAATDTPENERLARLVVFQAKRELREFRNVIDASYMIPEKRDKYGMVVRSERYQVKALQELTHHCMRSYSNYFYRLRKPQSLPTPRSMQCAKWCYYVAWFLPAQVGVPPLPRALTVQSVQSLSNGTTVFNRIPLQSAVDFAELLATVLTAGDSRKAPGLLLPHPVVKEVIGQMCQLLPGLAVMMVTDGEGGGLANVLRQTSGIADVHERPVVALEQDLPGLALDDDPTPSYRPSGPYNGTKGS